MRRGLILAAGCGGGGGKLHRGDAARLTDARARLDDAIDTEEILRTDKAQARKLRRIVALSPLPEAVPSLIDERARADFLRYAATAPPRALHRPAAGAVATMTATLDGKKDSQRVRGQPLSDYRREAERDVKPIWPDLARRLSDVSFRD